MDVFAIVGIIFILAYLVLGAYMSRRVKGLDDYYVAGRRAPAFLIAGTLIATNISSVGLIVYPGIAFERGPSLILLQFFSCWGNLLLGFWLGKRLIKLKLWTIPDFLGGRYNSESVRTVASIIVLVSMLIYLVSVLMGTTVAMMGVLGWGKITSLFIAVAIIAIFTVMGGQWSVIATDTLMAVVFVFGCLIMVPYMIGAGGGLSNLLAAAQQKIPYAFSWTGKMSVSSAVWFYIEANLTSLLLGMASPHLLSRVFLTDDERTLARALVGATVVYATWLLGFFFIIGLLPVLNPGIGKSADIYPWVARNLVPAFVGSIALSGVIAAAFSTASTMIQQAGATLSRDIYHRHINPLASEKTQLMVARFSIVVVSAVVLLAAIPQKLTSLAILYAFWFAASVWAGWAPALYLGLTRKKVSAPAAVWSMILGGLIAMVIGMLRMMKVYPLGPVPPILASLILSTVVFMVVNAMTRPKPEEITYFDNMEAMVAGKTVT